MNTKPLSEWTLGEAQKYCESAGCASCKIGNGHCPINGSPNIWDLSEPPRWTEQDKEDAKALKRLIPDAYIVWRYSTWTALQLYDECNNYILSLNNCFATLPLRESVTLDEIIGGGE